jgi:porphobilinogen synthase
MIQKKTNSYPLVRMRRNRQTDWSRRLICENILSANDLILPLFVCDGNNLLEPIDSLPGVNRYSIDKIIDVAKKAEDLQIPLLALFPVIDSKFKSNEGEEALKSDNLICRTIHEIKNKVPNIGIMTDVALDPYTSHGHDGILKENKILNDETIEALIKQALNQCRAGTDIIAPSDMMDGRILMIRNALEENNFKDTIIMSYAAKYASNYYGPFRDAIKSKNSLTGSKSTYQMDSANSNEAIREAELDINEGADMIMVKPGMPYLDIIFRIKKELGVPTFAYQVSGEYAAIKAASINGWLDYNEIILESLLCFKRSGADGILTYAAIDVAEKLLGK